MAEFLIDLIETYFKGEIKNKVVKDSDNNLIVFLPNDTKVKIYVKINH